jgi:hypothetical protein
MTDSEIREVALAALVAVLGTLPVANLMIGAWEVEGFIYNTARWLTVEQGLRLNLVVVVPVGFFSVLLIMIILDETKRIQRILIPLMMLFFAGILWWFDLWFETVGGPAGFVKYPVSLFLSLFVGVLLGVVDYIRHNGRLEFPIAGWVIYASFLFGVIAALIQLGIAGEIGILWGVGYLISGYIFLLSLAILVQHEDRKEVVIVASSEEPRTVLVGGLCNKIKKMGVKSKLREGASKMIFATAELMGDSLDPSLAPDSVIEFRYIYGDTSFFDRSRWISVRSENYELSYIKRNVKFSRRGSPETKKVNTLLRLVMKPFEAIVPDSINISTTGRRSIQETLDSADMIVVAISMSELTEESSDADVETVQNIVNRYKNSVSPEIMIVVTEAEKAKKMYEEKNPEKSVILTDDELKRYISQEFLDIRKRYYRDIIMVSMEREIDGSLDRNERWGSMGVILERLAD